MRKLKNVLGTLFTRRLVLTFDKVDFVYPRLSGRRRRNWLLAELAWALKSDKVWAYPTLLQIEPCNVCNLRCPVCHSVTDGKPQGFLPLDDFKKIMDEVGDDILFLHLWGWGEPFMNKDFFSMVKYAKAKGVQIISSTNGHFFESHGNIDKLIDSGLDVLIVALDGADPETYEKYRLQGDFERVLSGLRQLVKAKREKGARSPRINLRMLVTRENEDQVEPMKALAREIGVEIFSLKTLCSFDNESKGAELLPCRPEFRRFSYGPEGEPIRTKNTCKKFWNHPTIYRDGTVVLCDYHMGNELSLGNLFDRDGRANFGKIWFGQDFRRARAQVLKGDRQDTRCDSYALNYAGVDRCVSHAFGIEGGGVEES
jgi:MoaA/NifB/PqqE/SkfB family radical SAM enzyme